MAKREVTVDVLIAGGGLVGALAALLFARARPDWQLQVIEPQAEGPAQDRRTIALAAGTVDLLQQIGLWQQLAEQASPIAHIHVSDRGYLGSTRLHAHQEGVAALGQVIAAAGLTKALYEACQQLPNVQWTAGRRVAKVTQQQDDVIVQLDNGEEVLTRLIVGADGQHSVVREQLGIPMQRQDYHQVGIIARLELAEDMQGWAYERFTETGPMALLPIKAEAGAAAASLVWSLPPEEAAAMLAAPESEFVKRCQQAFGFRAGRFVGVSQRVSYPLQLQLAERSVHHRAVLIGNASHALHPIAGQGFNLGVRDVLALVDALKNTEDDAGSYKTLRNYWQAREQDYQRTIGLTELLVHTFSNHYAVLTGPRNLALTVLEKCGPLRSAFARQAMGKQ